MAVGRYGALLLRCMHAGDLPLKAMDVPRLLVLAEHLDVGGGVPSGESALVWLGTLERFARAGGEPAFANLMKAMQNGIEGNAGLAAADLEEAQRLLMASQR